MPYQYQSLFYETLTLFHIDELDLVNFFGIVRTTKAFLPLFKEQACTKIHADARILNITSVAGLVTSAGKSSYHASKFAAEAFSSSLRLELQSTFGIKVVTVNPSFHKTPLLGSVGKRIDCIWKGLSLEIKEEYGDGKFSILYRYFLSSHILCMTELIYVITSAVDFRNTWRHITKSLTSMSQWDHENVRDGLISCIETLHPPPQCFIGMDAKSVLLFWKILPQWFQSKAHDILQPFHPQPMKMQK